PPARRPRSAPAPSPGAGAGPCPPGGRTAGQASSTLLLRRRRASRVGWRRAGSGIPSAPAGQGGSQDLGLEAVGAPARVSAQAPPLALRAARARAALAARPALQPQPEDLLLALGQAAQQVADRVGQAGRLLGGRPAVEEARQERLVGQLLRRVG